MTHGGDIDPATRDELRELLAALREDLLTPEQEARLSHLLRGSDAALATYVRTLGMQADLLGYLVGWAAADPTGNGGDGVAGRIGPRPELRPGFQDTLYGLSVAEAALRPHADDEEEPLTPPPWSPRAAQPPSRLRIGVGGWGLLTALAAVLVIGIGVWLGGSWTGPDATPLVVAPPTVIPAASQPAVDTAPNPTPLPPAPSPAPPPPPPVVATVSASVGAVWDGQDAPKLGASLRAGRSIRLAGGYARLSFTNGADVVLEAPAQLKLDSPTRLALARGRLTANVPKAARGFTVATDAVDIVDLGTEFGVSVAPDGAVDVPVFTGVVEARPPQHTPAPAPAAPAPATQPARLVEAGQTGRVKDAGLKVAPAGPDAADYVRDIRNIRGRLPIRGTGEALAVGDPDPHWQITEVSNDPAWSPRPAVVCGPGPNSLDNGPRSAWVSTAGDRPAMPGGKYTFATTFDLTGFDPATARLRVALGVDNFVREVRLNGRPTGVTLSLPGNDAKTKLTASDLADGFLPGPNRLEIVVENGPGLGTKTRPNAMALRVDLSGTATRQLDTR